MGTLEELTEVANDLGAIDVDTSLRQQRHWEDLLTKAYREGYSTAEIARASGHDEAQVRRVIGLGPWF